MKSLSILTAIAALSTLAPAADQSGFRVIYRFDNPGDPSFPNGLVEADGVLYGTSTYGGEFGYGTVFALRPSAAGEWTLRVLHSFNPYTEDAIEPFSSPVIGPDGTLYGNTPYGGDVPACQFASPPGCGTVYKLQPPASPGGQWAETILYTFSGGSDGRGSTSSPVLCRNPSVCDEGALYGGNDSMLELQPPSTPGGAWTKKVLYGNLKTGAAGITMNDQGTLIGVSEAYFGGVFSLTPPDKPGKPWRRATLYTLRRHEGFDPIQPPTIAADGTIYGTTAGYCQDDGFCGVVWGSVFSLSPPSAPGGSWTYALVHSGGHQWVTSQALRRGDTIYATTRDRLLKIQRDPATGMWTTTVLHTFERNTVPEGTLAIDKSGTIFGTTTLSYSSPRHIAYSFKP